MSENKFIAGAVLFTFLELFFLSLLATNNSSINCPSLTRVTQDFNQSNGVIGAITTLTGSLGLLFSPCAGLPLWVYLLVFTPIAVAVVYSLTPFIH